MAGRFLFGWIFLIMCCISLFLLVVKYNLLDKNTVSHAEDLTKTNVCIILTLPVFCVGVLQDFSFSVNCLNTNCNCPTKKFEFV